MIYSFFIFIDLIAALLDLKIATVFYQVLSKLKSYFPYDSKIIEILFKVIILFGSIMIVVRSLVTNIGDIILHVTIINFIKEGIIGE